MLEVYLRKIINLYYFFGVIGFIKLKLDVLPRNCY